MNKTYYTLHVFFSIDFSGCVDPYLGEKETEFPDFPTKRDRLGVHEYLRELYYDEILVFKKDIVYRHLKEKVWSNE